MERKGLQDLSKIRLKEANALLRLGLFDGAYYLAGYAVECALKACIAKGTRRCEFPERKKVESSHSHNLLQLITVAKLDKIRDEHAGEDPVFWNNWDVVKRWSEQSRYERKSEESARELLAAVSDRRHGVVTWIKQQW